MQEFFEYSIESRNERPNIADLEVCYVGCD